MSICLVFGTTGQVGRAITDQVSAGRLPAGLEVVQLGRDQAEFSHPRTVASAVLEHRPSVVVNAAAYTKVDQAETDRDTAMLVNRDAPEAIAKACAKSGAALIHISTDYVFAGTGTAPYTETDPVAPTGIYGHSKADGEAAIRSALDRHVILRTAWVFSATGQNFVKTMLRLKRDPIRVVDDQIGNPTPAGAIAEATLTLAGRIASGTEDGWGTFHYSGQPAVSWFGFAKAIFAEAAKLGRTPPALEPITTAEYPLPARRPAWSVLDNAKIGRVWGISPPDWRQALPGIVGKLAAELEGAV